MAEIVVDGVIVKVDADDLPLLQRIRWRLLPNGYVVSTVYMHRLVTNAEPGTHVDHDDKNIVNNSKKNLIVCTPKQNAGNRRKYQRKKGSSSKYQGVSKVGKKWQASIHPDGKQVYLGMYESEEDAARARDVAALKFFGPRTYLNKV